MPKLGRDRDAFRCQVAQLLTGEEDARTAPGLVVIDKSSKRGQRVLVRFKTPDGVDVPKVRGLEFPLTRWGHTEILGAPEDILGCLGSI